MNAETYTELLTTATNVFNYINAESIAVSAQGYWSDGKWIASKDEDGIGIVFAANNTEGGAGVPVVAEFAYVNGKIGQLSKCHVAIIGSYEYYYGANCDLYAAPLDNVIDVRSGYRIGRFEAPQYMAQNALKFARESMAVEVCEGSHV